MKRLFFLTLIPILSFFSSAISSANESPTFRDVDGTLVVTIQYAARDFFYRSPSLFPPVFSEVKEAVLSQTLSIIVFPGNYAISGKGNADLSCDTYITHPNGKVDETLQAPIYNGKVENPTHIIFPKAVIKFLAKSTDEEGDYKIKVILKDNISGKSKTFERTISIKRYAIPPLPNDFPIEKWIQSYYQNPQPELAIPALRKIISSIPSDRYANAMPPILGFYDKILTDNSWLLPFFSSEFKNTLEKDNDPMQLPLAAILGYHFRNTSEIPDDIDSIVWQAITPMRIQEWPSVAPNAELVNASQLDMLWGQFFASGAYAPIRKITSALILYPYIGEIEKYKESQEQATEIPENIIKELILQATAWSLKSNASDHRLILAYLYNISSSDNKFLDGNSIAILRNIINEITEKEKQTEKE